jgi:hypothetical protein
MEKVVPDEVVPINNTIDEARRVDFSPNEVAPGEGSVEAKVATVSGDEDDDDGPITS